MSGDLAAESRPSLLFNWTHGRSRAFIIAGFILASTAAHALCFYVFQIVYPPTVALMPPPARVSLVMPDSEEGRALLNWIEAEDPALVSTTQRPPEAKAFALPKLQHVPSYTTSEPALKTLPPIAPDLRVPSSQPPAPVPIRRARAQAPPVAASTSLRFSEDFAAFGALQKPEPKFTSSSKEPPQNALFLVGGNGNGEIRFAFLQRSSGDATLDDQARQYLLQCRFTPPANREAHGEHDLVWGYAAIEWGNDIAAPASAATTPP